MEYVYAVVYENYPEVDVVYTNPEVAKAVCKQSNIDRWNERNTPIEYRRRSFEVYRVVKIPVDSGEPR